MGFNREREVRFLPIRSGKIALAKSTYVRKRDRGSSRRELERALFT
jgi:hypothetical protein